MPRRGHIAGSHCGTGRWRFAVTSIGIARIQLAVVVDYHRLDTVDLFCKFGKRPRAGEGPFQADDNLSVHGSPICLCFFRKAVPHAVRQAQHKLILLANRFFLRHEEVIKSQCHEINGVTVLSWLTCLMSQCHRPPVLVGRVKMGTGSGLVAVRGHASLKGNFVREVLAEVSGARGWPLGWINLRFREKIGHQLGAGIDVARLHFVMRLNQLVDLRPKNVDEFIPNDLAISVKKEERPEVLSKRQSAFFLIRRVKVWLRSNFKRAFALRNAPKISPSKLDGLCASVTIIVPLAIDCRSVSRIVDGPLDYRRDCLPSEPRHELKHEPRFGVEPDRKAFAFSRTFRHVHSLRYAHPIHVMHMLCKYRLTRLGGNLNNPYYKSGTNQKGALH